jgi:phosphatidylglycerol:prolipoprotein diacylglycerol transferase
MRGAADCGCGVRRPPASLRAARAERRGVGRACAERLGIDPSGFRPVLFREVAERVLPYVPPPHLTMGGRSFHLFGFLVGVGAALGIQLAIRRAQRTGLDERTMKWLLAWVTTGGFVGGHVLDLLVYEPRSVLTDPLSLLRIWESLGSFGGFAGTAIGSLTYFAAAGTKDRLGYADAIAWAFPTTWFFGRLGCAFAYDHVGAPTSALLGQRYADGVVRHNLGLEEALFTLALAASFWVLGRAPRRPGFFLGGMMAAYAPFRFVLDYGRVADARYLGLTPAQYGCALLGLAGVAFLRYRPKA